MLKYKIEIIPSKDRFIPYIIRCNKSGKFLNREAAAYKSFKTHGEAYRVAQTKIKATKLTFAWGSKL